ncbi:biotin--[acetyl-CoA-carboxylase] ligase [Gloeocapsa sp. PCC 73106]|uniref:biotin--[acetyl-CoA-carboxylase] ligase n=1 Tax=Gloeocapsa sp. PCC 73106 TaxID=102232 RepID=UPI0002AC39F2|nr:biotin--[acetyl-CoA-carboxylase] ligase [Gloeocapsa sp. PCC 73106]ELS00206.1 birA, biotin-(acetyl-CoA-carboxylase) ligase [Gloeocapsa sp. PCC 73106]
MDKTQLQKLNLPIELDIFTQIPSTNTKLWQLIDEGQTLPRVAIALAQTAGRGQWGRTWQSPPGGLYLSLGLTPNLPIDSASHLVFAVAWGVATRLRSLELPILLKWPNDLILQGRKLGGIKIENRISQNRITHSVIGIGINYSNPVPDRGINLAAIADKLSLEQLAILTIEGIWYGYTNYLKEGIEPILLLYEQLLINLGQKITFNRAEGVVTGVTADGELRVRFFSSGASVEICLQPGTINLGYCEEILPTQ